MGNSQHGFGTNRGVAARGAARSTTGTASGVDNTMHTRTSTTQFGDLIKAQDTLQLVRVTPKHEETTYGHLLALGPGGFCLSACRELIIKGIPCCHTISALLQTHVVSHGACVAPRWRTSATPWTMELVASKPARLASVSVGNSAGQ